MDAHLESIATLRPRLGRRWPQARALLRPSSYGRPLWIPPLPDGTSSASERHRLATPGLLRERFTFFGGDKATTHDNQTPYAESLRTLPARPLLEVGIGTNHLDVPSTMGAHGVPGASLRAWESLGPFEGVYRGDVDRRILFEEPSISTHHIDQFEMSTLAELARDHLEQQPAGFSLVLDGRLHTARAIINSAAG